MKDISLRKKVMAVFLDKDGKFFSNANDDSGQIYFCDIPLKGDLVSLELDVHDALIDEDIKYLIPFLEEFYPEHKGACYKFEVQQRYVNRSGGESWISIFLKYIG